MKKLVLKTTLLKVTFILGIILTGCTVSSPTQIPENPQLSIPELPTSFMETINPPQSQLTEKLVCDSLLSIEEGYRLFLVDLQTGSKEQLTEIRAFKPKWSPDGKYIAFISYQGNDLSIVVMDLNGKIIHEITDDKGYNAQFDWSPDGKKIVFVSERDGNSEIYTQNLETNEVTRLTFNNIIDGEPSWSSDGTQITFDSIDEEGRDWISIMDTNGDHQQKIISGPYLARPFWGPDDSCLIYEKEVYGKYMKHNQLFAYDFRTGEETQLVKDFSSFSDESTVWLGSLIEENQLILLHYIDDEQNLMMTYDMENETLLSLGVEGGACDYP